MTTYAIEGQRLTNIANAIRSKTGSADALSIDEMATEIEGISTGNGVVSWNDLTDKPFYEIGETVKTLFFDYREIEMEYDSYSNYSYSTDYELLRFGNIKAGETYIVEFNNVEYVLTAYEMLEWGGSGSVQLGEYYTYDPRTDIPFTITTDYDYELHTPTLYIQAIGEMESCSLRMYKLSTEAKKLDDKYLPMTYRTVRCEEVIADFPDFDGYEHKPIVGGLIEGDTYIVTLDDVEYERVAFSVVTEQDDGYKYTTIYVGVQDVDPFFISGEPGMNNIYFQTTDGKTHKLFVRHIANNKQVPLIKHVDYEMWNDNVSSDTFNMLIDALIESGLMAKA